MPCLPGMTLGGTYKILDVLGKGGNGTVYLARHERAGRLWAVKEIPQKGNRLIMEAELLKKLHHPGLPSVGDILEDGGMLYLVMDYIEGRSLKQLLESEGAQSQEKAVDWACQLCQVLSYLHTRVPPVIYRDLKPSNIMLKEDGTVVLVDFGTARERKKKADADTECLGTRGYAAPEQYGGKGQTGPETDVYGLGAVLYHLLTGKNPSEPPYGCPPVRSIRPELSGGLEKVLEICTKNDPEERYHSCSDLLNALEHYEELDEIYLRRRRQKRLLLGGLVFLILAVGAGILVTRHAGKVKLAKTYEAYLTEASGSVDKTRKKELLKHAVSVEPGRAEAYKQLLQCFLEDDGVFSREEEIVWQQVLGEKGTGGKNSGEALAENKKAYVQAAYDAGLMYFYYYEGSEGKGAAARWFKVAAEAKPGKELPEYAVFRAEVLSRISGYYDLLSLQQKTGDAVVSYGEYWEDLTALTDRDFETEDNRVTALVTYREMVLQIALHAEAFKREGVEKQELYEQIILIQESLAQWRTDEKTKRAEYEETLLLQVEDGIRAAKKTVEAVYQETKQTG